MKLIFKIEGMCCTSEVVALKRVLGPLVGGREDLISFDLINEKVTLEVEENPPTEKQVMKAIQETGMKGIPWKDHVKKTGQKEGFFQRFGRFISTGLSAVGLVTGFAYHAATQSASAAFAEDTTNETKYPVASIVLYAGAIVAGGALVVPKALRAIRQLRPNTELLMTVAVVGAVAIDQWFEAAAVVFLFSASILLEQWNLGRARKAIRGLMDLAPSTARVVENALSDDDALVEGADIALEMRESKEGGEAPSEVIREKAIEDISVGTIIIVSPGEKIPMDSVLLSDMAEVNQAPVTGESMPVHKKPGDELFAGSINGDSAIRCRVTKAASDSTLAHIVRLVEEAQSRRSQSEQVSEKFARYYTPTMMFIALIVAVVVPPALGEPFEPWIYQALTLLVISCPCALVISTPLTITAGLGAAARAGVLIKGGVYLEAPAHVKAFAMDKTGTLTSGEPKVREVVPLQGYSRRAILKLAALLETHSDHPLARAIRREAAAAGATSHEKVEQFQVTKGKGAEGYIRGKLFWLGSARFLREKTGGTEPGELKQMEEGGRSIVAVGCGDQVYGLISIADSVRPEAKAMARDLKAAGIQKVVMLTGDHKGTAKAIAEAVGIDDYRAELLPADKVSAVEGLVREYKQVAMVGDGINDTPAMAIAGLGIAMGAAGSDAAIETADIALMSDNLEKLPWLVKHSRRTMTIIKENIAFSLSIKALFAGLAFAKKANLWMAIAADMGSSFIVIFNGLRLLNDQATCQPKRRNPIAIPVVIPDSVSAEALLFLSPPGSPTTVEEEEERLYGSPLSPVGKSKSDRSEEKEQGAETLSSGRGVMFHYSAASGSTEAKEKDLSPPSSPSPSACKHGHGSGGHGHAHGSHGQGQARKEKPSETASPKPCCSSESGCKSKGQEPSKSKKEQEGQPKKKAHGHAHDGEHGHSHGGGHGHAHGMH